ncbi:MAG: hypothetical protein OXE46_00865 [Chloroflexi bacterium]|nr:hypothetical protein [Chloroflexota bacterium]
MSAEADSSKSIFPREKWFWLGLLLLLLLAGWLYLRGYNVSLPFIEHVDEPQHLLAAQHLIDDGTSRAVYHDAAPPGMKTLNYLLLKHIKPPDSPPGMMLPALRLVTIAAWVLVALIIALLGRLVAHPLTGLMAAAIWIVNPWVVERAHFALPDAYLTVFTLLAIWLALLGSLRGRQNFSTAAVYSIMLAIVFKTQALFVAPLVVLLPLASPARVRAEAAKQVFWNCVRFGFFLFWLLLIYPTLDAHKIPFWPQTENQLNLPSPHNMLLSLAEVLATFQPLPVWLGVALAGGLLMRYRRRLNRTGLFLLIAAALAWLAGMSMFPIQTNHLRQFFAVGALSALGFGLGLTGLLYAGEEILARLDRQSLRPLVPGALFVLLGLALLPSYRESDALAQDFSLPDRRNELTRYFDTSLEPGMYIANYDNHKTFNRAWGGYMGLRDFPTYPQNALLSERPIDEWRALGVDYAILPHHLALQDPSATYPGETIALKTYPASSQYRGPDMVVLRLHPMQNEHGGKLGSLQLLGYDISSTIAQAGDDIVFRHYWAAESAPANALHVFNHLLNDQGEIAAQVDGIPLFDSRRDSSSWDDPDEILLGRNFILRLPADLPPATYTLVTGLYDAQTGARQKSADDTDHLLLAEITVIVSPSQ